MRHQEQQVVVAPEMCPGKNGDDEPEIEADKNAHGELKVLQPSGNRAGIALSSVLAGGRTGSWGSFWKQAGLLRHADGLILQGRHLNPVSR